jgi:hypothetical protein
MQNEEGRMRTTDEQAETRIFTGGNERDAEE